MQGRSCQKWGGARATSSGSKRPVHAVLRTVTIVSTYLLTVLALLRVDTYTYADHFRNPTIVNAGSRDFSVHAR